MHQTLWERFYTSEVTSNSIEHNKDKNIPHRMCFSGRILDAWIVGL